MKVVLTKRYNPGNLLPVAQAILNLDSNTDGVCDGFGTLSKIGNPTSSAAVADCQVLKSKATANGDSAYLVSEPGGVFSFPLAPGQTPIISAEMAHFNIVGNGYVQAYFGYLDAGGAWLATTGHTSNVNTPYFQRVSTLQQYVTAAPAGTVKGIILILHRLTNPGDEAISFIRNIRVTIGTLTAHGSWLQEYSLPSFTTIKKRDLKIRSKMEKKSFSHGGVDVGDGMIDSRILEMHHLINGASETDFALQQQNLVKSITNEDFRLYDLADNSRFINVKRLSEFNTEFQEGFGLARGTIKEVLQCEDPFFYDSQESGFGVKITTLPSQIFTIPNNSPIEVFPVIRIFADQGASDFNITNLTDSNRQFRYNEASFTQGEVVVIDSENGMVQRRGGSTLRYFSGSFLRLLPGDNQIKYDFDGSSGGQVILHFSWRGRYL